jgi:C1A family cysteine protease
MPKRKSVVAPKPAGGSFGFGWRPDLPDARDFRYSIAAPIPLPLIIDLRPQFAHIPVFDQKTTSSCFPAGTFIRMADGTEREIENIKLGERVVTAESNTGMVTQLMIREYNGPMISLKIYGKNDLLMTPNHPVLTKRGYVKAEELLGCDWVALPRYRNKNIRYSINPLDFMTEKELCIQTVKRKLNNVLGRGIIGRTINIAKIPEKIELTERFGRLIGFFLAEGRTSNGKLGFSFALHELNTFVAETVSILKDYNIDAHVRQKPIHHSVDIGVYLVGWARFFERLCGTGAGLKTIHPMLLEGPDEFLKGILDGWLAGDGHYRKRCGRIYRHNGVTVSKHLAYAMYDIMQYFGMRPCLSKCKPTVNQYAKIRRISYRLEISLLPVNNCVKSELTATTTYRKITRLRKTEFNGFVYNMHVEGDESYVAEGVGVHNCVAQSASAAVSYLWMKQGIPHQIASRLFIYYNTRVMENSVNEDAGAMIRDAIKSLASFGAPDEQLWPFVLKAIFTKPSEQAYAEALKHQVLKYERVSQTETDMETRLAEGFPIIGGFTVYDSFMSQEVAKTGIAKMPDLRRERANGGHAITVIGYRQKERQFIVRNSWGAEWGSLGHFFMPYDYFLDDNLADDFWTVEFVEQ